MNRKERRAAAKQGNSAAVGAALAVIASQLEQAGKIDEAVRKYRDALAADPTIGDAANNLGNLLRNQGRVDEAIIYFERAIRLDPRGAIYHNNLGNVYLDQ